MKTNKLSSKKRKLLYIREKNHLRLGGEIREVLKISNSKHGDNYTIDYIDSEIERNHRKYKMLFNVNIQIGQENDDFLHNLTTVLLTYKKVNNKHLTNK